jgi:hypothetical protein
MFYQIEIDNKDELSTQTLVLQNVNEACDCVDRLQGYLPHIFSVHLFEVESEILDSGEEIYNKRKMR